MQGKLDAWHRANPGPIADIAGYQAFQRQIGYLISERETFSIGTHNVDAEIATMAGPQLVGPSLLGAQCPNWLGLRPQRQGANR